MMRRLDRLILIDIVGPWIFGVAIFTVLIAAGSFLFQLSNYLVKGISVFTVLELMVLLLPGIMAKTFPMAVLLATLLGFGRLSGDSEITAIRAAGVSLYRVMLPVALFGVFTAGLALVTSEFVVPFASGRALILQEEIKKKIELSSEKTTSYPIKEDGKVKGVIAARNFSIADRTLQGVTITSYDEGGEPQFFLVADEMRYENDSEWRIVGKAVLLSADATMRVELEDGAWPEKIPKMGFKPVDLQAESQKDSDSRTLAELRSQIDEQKRSGKASKGQIVNLEYQYWNKISFPLAALVYAIVGAPLGIRNHRTGAASGFWMAVIIIFCYMLVSNILAITAQGGAIPAYVASFTPVLLGLIAGGVTIHLKNR